MATFSVRVNAICPAFIETPMLDRAGMSRGAETRAASLITGEALLADDGAVAR